MRVAYHLTVPLPPQPRLDGAIQEALWLQQRFAGPLGSLYPLSRHSRWLPPALCGMSELARLRRLDAEVDLHHVFSDRLRDYPALAWLARPVVLTVLTAARPRRGWLPGRGAVRRVVCATEEQARELRARTASPVEVIPPGVDPARFTHTPPPADGGFVLLAGSAPWSRRQFRTKGLDLMLAAVRRVPDLRLVLLWRGVLRDEIDRRVAAAGLEQRVEVLDREVDVARLLPRVHAAIVLAARPQLVKACPHSLIEALAAARPVIVSRGLGLDATVETHGCGALVERFDLAELLSVLARVRGGYASYQGAAARTDLSAFSRERFLAEHARAYERALAAEG